MTATAPPAHGRIEATFARLARDDAAGFVPFIMAGDPSLGVTLELMRAAAAGGADLIELGVPFSDPMADGPVLQRSAERALARGTKLPAILEVVARFRAESSIPVVLFGYTNPFFRYGPERLGRDAAQSGVDGILCVDMPPEESQELKAATDASDIALIFLLAPTSDDTRVGCVLAHARGFVYYVSVTGVTGAATPVTDEVRAMVQTVKARTSLPVGVGFGISTPAQAAAVAQFADAVIVGSAVMRVIEECGAADPLPAAGEFFRRMAIAVHAARRAPHAER